MTKSKLKQSFFFEIKYRTDLIFVSVVLVDATPEVIARIVFQLDNLNDTATLAGSLKCEQLGCLGRESVTCKLCCVLSSSSSWLLNILELRTLQVQQRRILNINVLPILLLRPYHYRNLSLTSHWSLEAKDVE